MARIPDDLLERIRRDVPIQTLAVRAGVELRPHGDNLLGRCPWHDDKTPSLVLTPSKNLWHCMGSCQIGGSPIDWVMKAEGVSFRHAVEILRADFFPTSPSLDGPPSHTTVPQLASPLESEASDRELLGQVIDYYHQTLKESPEALAYLEKRSLRHPELVDHFKLGYANRTLGYRLPAMNRKAGQEIRTRLQKLGVLRESGHEHLSGSLVIPILGESGEVLGAYGRKIRGDLRSGTPDHLYLPGPHRGVFNVEALKASKEVILCEALIDALTFWCAGYRNVTAAYGVEGFTHDHLAAFKAYGTEQILIAYDRDDAGDGAAERLSKKLMAEGIACSRIQFPKGMDANDYALKVQPPAKALGVLIRSAVWMGNGRPHARAVAHAVNEAARLVPPPAEAAQVEREEETPGREEAATAPSPLPPLAASGTDGGAAKEENLGAEAPESTATVLSPALNGDDEALFRFDDRSYRVRGLKKALQSGSLHVTVRAQREGDLFAPPSPIAGWFLDKFDFISSRQRALFEKQAAHEMGVRPEVVKWDLGQVVRALEGLQETARLEALKPKTLVPAMTDEDRAEGLEYASAEDLIERILADYERCGVVGETTNGLLGYLGTVSRLSERPLGVIIRSSSAAGKSALMEAILRFVPPEAREKYSALSGHALFYFEGKDFKHKVLAIVEEEGASRASYALKLLQSEGEISIASTGKDPGTGRLVTKEYRVEGPVMIFLTSTAVEIDEELLNRALVLTVDEGRAQTRAIHRLQRESQTLEALWAREEREEVYRRHHNLQRLLRPLPVVNPYVRELTFLDDRTRTRRDHTKYLGLIEAIALLHQYQRPRKTAMWGGKTVGWGERMREQKTKEYIEATLDDIALANRIAAEVLGRSLDELPPQTRRLLLVLDDFVRMTCAENGVGRSDVRFTLRDVRAFSGLSHDQLWRHMQRLVTLEYLLVHKGGRGQTFVYELLYDGQGKDGTPFLIGLADVQALAKAHGLPVPKEILPPLPRHEPVGGTSGDESTTPTSAEEKGTSAEVSRVHLGAIWVGSAGHRKGLAPAPGAGLNGLESKTAENAHQGPTSETYSDGGRTDGNDDAPHRKLVLRRVSRAL